MYLYIDYLALRSRISDTILTYLITCKKLQLQVFIVTLGVYLFLTII
ncbi:MAG: hypothetical protein ACI9LL_000524 [Porticoccus sp.]|jgi:hypothetical protein